MLHFYEQLILIIIGFVVASKVSSRSHTDLHMLSYYKTKSLCNQTEGRMLNEQYMTFHGSFRGCHPLERPL